MGIGGSIFLIALGAIRALRPQLERLEPDLVHIQTPFIAHYQGTALARALRIPVIEMGIRAS